MTAMTEFPARVRAVPGRVRDLAGRLPHVPTLRRPRLHAHALRALKVAWFVVKLVWRTLRAFAAGLVRVWDALVIWFGGEDLAEKGLKGGALFRALRARLIWSGIGLVVVLAAFGYLTWKVHSWWALPLERSLWTSAGMTLAPALLWVLVAGWDRNLANNVPGRLSALVKIDAPNILAACASATKTKPELWGKDRIVGQDLTWTRGKPRWWEITINPPGSITPTRMIGLVAEIASYLGLDPGWVTVEKAHGAAVRISGCEADPWESLDLRVPHALAKTATDVFGACPFARTARGQLISIPLMWMGWLIAAVMRVGKTTAGRVIATFIALDPIADLAVFDFKGTGWGMFEPICVRFSSGPGRDKVRGLYEWLLWLEKDIERRAKVIEGIGAGTDGKISRKISGQRHLDLRPITTMIDEAHEAFEDDEYGEKIAALFARVQKRGPAFGITFIVLTQLPQAESVPTKVRNAIVGRVALKLMYPEDSRAALGASAGRAGFDASDLPYEPGKTEGRAILQGAGPDPLWIRVLSMTADQAEELVRVAIELRREAGVLPGQDTPPPDAVVLELHRILTSREGTVLSREAAEHLARLELIRAPEGQTDDNALPRALARHLKPWGIRPSRDDTGKLAAYRIEEVQRAMNGQLATSP